MGFITVAVPFSRWPQQKTDIYKPYTWYTKAIKTYYLCLSYCFLSILLICLCVSFCPQKEVRESLENILQIERSQEGCDCEEAYVQLYVDTIQVLSEEEVLILFLVTVTDCGKVFWLTCVCVYVHLFVNFFNVHFDNICPFSYCHIY